MTDARYARWIERAREARAACARLGGELPAEILAPPATEAEVEVVERALGRRLPASFRRVVLGLSARIELGWQLPEEAERPVRDVFSGGLAWDLAALPELETSRTGWIRECFGDEANAYDRVWHRKVAIAHVPNGDLVGIDPEVPGEPLVYLSHEDGPGHGWRLGADFEDAMDRLATIGFVGPEDWQWVPFVTDRSVGIDPHHERARAWRTWLGLGEP